MVPLTILFLSVPTSISISRCEQILKTHTGNHFVLIITTHNAFRAHCTRLKKQKRDREYIIRQFKSYATHLFKALEYLHFCKISHGDVKLTNTIFCRSSVKRGWSFTLLDFGMSMRVHNVEKTYLSFNSGTSAFLAPEAAIQVGSVSCGML